MLRRRSWCLTLALAALATGCATEAARPSSLPAGPLVEVSDGEQLSDSDVATILDLAQRLGVDPVERVRAGYVTSGNCRGVIVYERITFADPTSVSRRSLAFRRVGASCPLLSDESHDVVVQNGWKTSPLAMETRAWRRVQLGDWHADFQLGDGVSYDSAEDIVRSLRLGEVHGDTDRSDLDPGSIQWILRGDRASGPGPSDVFDVCFAGQTWLTVRLGPDGVTALGRRPVQGRT